MIHATTKIEHASDGIHNALLIGSVIVALFVVGLGGWASTAPLAGAVLASGTVVVESNVKKVQHPTGGIVGEIHVRDGDKVHAGDLVLRLDETITRANLAVITSQLDELAGRQARLEAERDQSSDLDIPEPLRDRLSESKVEKIIAGERALLNSRRSARLGQTSQLRERIAQLDKEIGGLDAQSESKTREIDLIAAELAGTEKLWAKDLVPMTKITALRREAARLYGERAQLVASVAQAKGKVAEIELQIIQVDQDLRTEVVKELRDLQGKQSELMERRVAAEDQLKRVDIRAPQSGVVHQLAAHTIGGVINPGEPIMLIVPEGDGLVVEARVSPQDINNVWLGQKTTIRFTAFNQRTTPEFDGKVTRVSADLMRDPQSNQPYYLARVQLANAQKFGLALVPGMPAEVHIRTGERTLMSYLFKPLRDQFALAFTER